MLLMGRHEGRNSSRAFHSACATCCYGIRGYRLFMEEEMIETNPIPRVLSVSPRVTAGSCQCKRRRRL